MKKSNKVVKETGVVVDLKKMASMIKKINKKQIGFSAEKKIKLHKNGQRSPVYRGKIVEKNSKSKTNGQTLLLCPKEFSDPDSAIKHMQLALNKIIAIIQLL